MGRGRRGDVSLVQILCQYRHVALTSDPQSESKDQDQKYSSEDQLLSSP